MDAYLDPKRERLVRAPLDEHDEELRDELAPCERSPGHPPPLARHIV